MRVTIKDIAKNSGFSIATVSQVLNGNKKARISEETQKKILKIAKEMNYVPNLQAISLIKHHSNTLGLIVPDISNQFFCKLAKGVEMEASKYGYSTFFCNTDDAPSRDAHYLKKMIEQNVAGVIIATAGADSGSAEEDCFQLASTYHMPIVFADRPIPNAGAVSVYFDHERGGYLATKHLIELGHRKIACLTGYMNLAASKHRFFGYLKALQESGIAIDHNLVVEGDFHFKAGYDATKSLLKNGATAIFACNDMMAFGVYMCMQDLGLSIPKDLSLVGYDNSSEDMYSMLPITTINQDANKVGMHALHTILHMIEGRDQSVETMILEPTLLVRGSTAPLLKRAETDVEDDPNTFPLAEVL